MLKRLIGIRLRSMWSSVLRASNRGKRKGSKVIAILFGLLLIYCVIVFAFLFGFMAQSLAGPFHMIGLDWLYFALLFATALVLMVVGTVFAAKNQLYEARDNELLLSMPIPPKAILASRMVSLLLLNLAFCLLVLIPAGVVWQMDVGFSPLGAAAFVLIVLALPLLGMALEGLFGWLLALLTQRSRHKSLWTLILSLVFFAAYFYVYSQMSVYLQYLLENSQTIASALRTSPLYWLGAAPMGEPLYLVLSLALLVLPFLLVYWILSRTFLHIALMKPRTIKRVYRERLARRHSPRSALLRKELRLIGSSPTYMLNAGIGPLMAIAAMIFLVIQRNTIANLLLQMSLSSDILPVIACFGLCLLLGMEPFTAPSISLEGKTLWLLRSIPVSNWTVLRSKLEVHLLLTLPVALIAGGLGIAAAGCTVLEGAGLLLTAILYCALAGQLGLIINLLLPRFDWYSQSQVVKQSMSVMITMLVTMLTAIAPIIIFFAISGVTTGVYLLCCAGVCVLINLLLLWWLRTKGAARLGRLG